MASLRTYLTVVLLAATVPLAGFAFVLAQRQAVAVREQMQSLVQRSAVSFALNVERDLLSAANLLVGLSHSPALKDADPTVLRRALEYGSPLRAGLSGIDLLDAEGSVLYSTDPPTSYPQPRAPSTLQQVRSTKQPAVTELLHSQYTGEWLTSVKVPVVVDGSVRYVLSGHIPAAHWQRLIAHSTVAKGAFLTLVDANSRVIAESEGAGGAIGRVAKMEDILEAGTGRRWLSSSIVAEQPVLAIGGWKVGAGFASPPLIGTQAGTLALMFIAGAASLALGLILAMMVARRVAEPVAQLSQGDPDAVREPVVVSEIAGLRAALHSAARQRELAVRALQSKAGEFEALFMGSPVGLALSLDRAATHAMINPALASLLGVEAGVHDLRALLGASGSGLRVCRRGRPIELDEQPLQRASASGKSVEEVEIELLHADGRRFDIAVHATPLRDESSEPRGAVAAFVDITDRKLIEHERARLMVAEQQARRAAESANRGKDEFLAILGHELRNPLSAICAAVEVLNRVPPDGAAAVSARSVLARKTRHMTQLMNDLQDVARIGAGKIELDRQPLDLAHLVWRALDSMRLEGRFKRHALTLQLEPAVVVADAMRIEQVVVNLLINAVKYTPPGGHVQLVLAGDAEGCRLEVRDNGLGITSGFLPHVFELFAQSDSATERREGGMGLGLTLVRRLVELHGGDVTAHSEGTNRGSTFTLRLPRATSAVVSAADADALAAADRSGAGDDAARAFWNGRHVIVVEADETLPFGIVKLLALGGCRVTAAPDGLTALNVVIAARPDAVLVDLAMPRNDAQALVDGIRAVGARTALYAMSAGREPAPPLTGFAAVLAKPVQPVDLRRHLQASPAWPALGA